MQEDPRWGMIGQQDQPEPIIQARNPGRLTQRALVLGVSAKVTSLKC